ncbi:low affinity iron permease family protein [Phenylobacterium sp.]|jgi:low affinity Fe/Cu permease|uniref:low affinity iron permease family protein n=1 Tax=Phenylobacterium sp. TaxID=1871053 RepID=UPI002F3FF013
MDKASRAFTAMAGAVSTWTGRPSAFLLCCLIVIVWAATGPMAHYSDTWQLIINTGTTIVTFLMVFLIQNTQNRDNAAIQAKLDELILTSKARNEFIGIEHLTDTEIGEMLELCEKHRPDDVKRVRAAATAGEKREMRTAQRKAARAAAKPLTKSEKAAARTSA